MSTGYPWYDSPWLRAYVDARTWLKQHHPDHVTCLDRLLAPLRTDPDFKVITIDDVFDMDTLGDLSGPTAIGHVRYSTTGSSVVANNMTGPGPDADQLEQLLTLAARVPDHGKLAPWRFIIFEGDARARFGELIAARYAELNPDAEQKFIDIEREAKLGGKLHSKAVMIVSSYLASTYAKEHPLALHASLVFEQSYGGIEGDSASIAEVCALMSAIIDRPVNQRLAITGSMDQHGNAQAVGGVNEKIEGFFEICHEQGLTGNQGVILPEANLPHLMLRDDVVTAVTEGRFHIYAVASVDDAAALLLAADGEELADMEEVNRAIRERLQALHAIARQDLQREENDND